MVTKFSSLLMTDPQLKLNYKDKRGWWLRWLTTRRSTRLKCVISRKAKCNLCVVFIRLAVIYCWYLPPCSLFVGQETVSFTLIRFALNQIIHSSMSVDVISDFILPLSLGVGLLWGPRIYVRCGQRAPPLTDIIHLIDFFPSPSGGNLSWPVCL